MSVEFTSNKAAVKHAFDSRVNAALDALALETVANALNEVDASVYNAPVSASGYRRTSELRGSISAQVDRQNKEIIFGAGVHYGIYVEMGTYKMAAQPYITPALNNYKQDYEDVVRAVLGAK